MSRFDPLLEAFFMQPIPTGITERQRVLPHSKHRFIANGAIVIFFRHPLLALGLWSLGSGGFAYGFGVCCANTGVGDGGGCLWGMGKDVFELGSEKGLLVPVYGVTCDLKDFEKDEQNMLAVVTLQRIRTIARRLLVNDHSIYLKQHGGKWRTGV